MPPPPLDCMTRSTISSDPIHSFFSLQVGAPFSQRKMGTLNNTSSFAESPPTGEASTLGAKGEGSSTSVGEALAVGSATAAVVHDVMYHSWGHGHCPYVLPTPAVPPPEEYAPVEKFVAGFVESLFAPPGLASAAQQRSQGMRAIGGVLRTREDPAMLFKVLLALRTAGHGSALRLLSSDSRKADSLLQLIFAVDPFVPPDTLVQTIAKEIEDENKAGSTSPMRSRNKSPPPTELAANILIDPERLRKDPRLQPFFSFQIADAHLHLLVALASANSIHVTHAVSAIWKMATKGLADCPTERITRVHAALYTLVRICPKAKSEIFPAMASNFPFKLLPSNIHLWYFHQCLAVVKYVPQLQKDVLELFIDRCLEIDVEIKIEDSGDVKLDESKEEKEDDGAVDDSDIFGIDLDPTDDNKQQMKKNEESQPEEESVDEMAEKLDTLMLIIFQHIAMLSKSQEGGKTPRELFDMVMPVFDTTIMTTHRSKYVQFVLFLLCALDYEKNKAMNGESTPAVVDDESLYRIFTGKLIEIMLDPLRATTMRQSAACYLASFLSRSNYVCIETVCETVSALLSTAEAYMLTFPTEKSTVTAFRGMVTRNQCEAHGLFYTVCQAAFYIMCFRGGDAVKHYGAAVAKNVANTEDATDVEGINIGIDRWSKLCSHHLNPLRYCLESVRGEFLHLASVLDLLEPSLLQALSQEDKKLSTGAKRPKKSRSILTPALMAKKRAKEGVGGLGRGSNPLNSFFPFDPYLLRQSNIFIDSYYQHWNGSIDESYDDSVVAAEDVDDSLNTGGVTGYESEDSSASDGSDSSSSASEEERMAMTPADDQAMSLVSVASVTSAAAAAGKVKVIDPRDRADSELSTVSSINNKASIFLPPPKPQAEGGSRSAGKRKSSAGGRSRAQSMGTDDW